MATQRQHRDYYAYPKSKDGVQIGWRLRWHTPEGTREEQYVSIDKLKSQKAANAEAARRFAEAKAAPPVTGKDNTGFYSVLLEWLAINTPIVDNPKTLDSYRLTIRLYGYFLLDRAQGKTVPTQLGAMGKGLRKTVDKELEYLTAAIKSTRADIPVGQIGINTAREWIAYLKLSYCGTTIINNHSRLITLWNWMVAEKEREWGIMHNPLKFTRSHRDMPKKEFRPAKMKRQNQTMDLKRYFTQAECMALIAELDKHHNKWVGTWARLLYLTGARCGHLAQLTPERIDWEKGFVNLHKEGESVNKRGSYRFIDFQLANVLKRFEAMGGKWGESKVYYARVIRQACTKLGIEIAQPNHGFRHTFSTYLIESGMDVGEVQLLMGHSTIETTLQHYTHGRMKAAENAAALMKLAI